MTAAIATAQFPVVADGLAAYVRAARDIPDLSADDERRLALAFRENGDLEAARKMALAHLKLVVSVADNYDGYGLPRADLIQEGNLGLLRAVQRFDPDRAARLATFAVYWIRAGIHEFILRNWRIVKIATTKAQRKLFFNMRRLTATDESGKMENSAALARDLEVRPQDVSEMRRRLADTVAAPLDGDDDNPGASACLAADTDETDVESRAVAAYEHRAGRDALRDAMTELPERDRDILKARRLSEPPATLQTLADRFGVSAERVRQLENRAMEKVAASVRARMAA